MTDVARVEHFEQIDVSADRIERLAADGAFAVRVEGVRHVDQAALLLDARDRFARREAARDVLLQEEADDLALLGKDLLAHDNGERSPLLEREGAVDFVVVGNSQRADAASPAHIDDGIVREQAVARVPRVGVQFNFHTY